MKKTINYFSIIIILLLLTPSFSFVHAADFSLNINQICDGSLAHPCDFNAVFKIINLIINWVITSSVVIATITFMIAGGQILLNPSNPKKREEGIEMAKKTVIGIIIVLMAWLVVHTILATFTNINVTGVFFK